MSPWYTHFEVQTALWRKVQVRLALACLTKHPSKKLLHHLCLVHTTNLPGAFH